MKSGAPGRVLFTQAEIQARVKEMGREIRKDFTGLNSMAICVEKGAVFFFADLIRAINLPMEIGFMQIDSDYGNSTTSGGEPKIRMDPNLDIAGKNILIVEDIVDSGNSMHESVYYIQNKMKAKTTLVATFLDKPKARKVKFRPTYVGFEIEPHFVVGYGLDFCQKYRLCPTVNALPNFAGVAKPHAAFKHRAENCLVLGDRVGPDDLQDLIEIARDFGATYPARSEAFLVAQHKDGTQLVLSKEGLRRRLEKLTGVAAPAIA